VPIIHANSQPGFARPGGSLPPDPPRAGHAHQGPAGGKPPPGPPSCRTPLLPTTTNFKTRYRGLRKIGLIFFSTNLTHARVVHRRGRGQKKKKTYGPVFPLHREMCAARRRVRYINVPTCFGRNCPLFFLKLGEKKHPPSSFSLFFFPKIHTLMYGTITQYTYVRTRAGC